jgi:hypothetical protein
MNKALTAMFAVGLLALLPSPSQAQIAKGRFRLNVDTRLLDFTAATIEADDAPHPETKYRNFEIGLGAPEVGFGLGYAVIDGLIVGGRIAISFLNATVDPEGPGGDDETKTFGLRILPYVEYGFNIGKVVPFVVATLGFRTDLVKNENVTDNKSVTNLFVMGAGGGAHFFLAPSFSLDASLLIYGGFGGRNDEAEANNVSVDVDYGVRAFELSLLVGLSGWL